MRLSTEQQKFLREESGVIGNEVCDTCGAVLGCVRFTRRGEAGEWCSRECRDGKVEAAAIEARREKRRAGRPSLELSETAKMKRIRAQQRQASRLYRERHKKLAAAD